MHPYLETAPVWLFGETLLWERSLVFILLYLWQIKSFLFLVFCSVVPLGLTLTERGAQLQVTMGYALCTFRVRDLLT